MADYFYSLEMLMFCKNGADWIEYVYSDATAIKVGRACEGLANEENQ